MTLRVDPVDCITTPDYWDCECDEDYIHPKADLYCPRCDMHPDEQPDSRVVEVEGPFAVPEEV